MLERELRMIMYDNRISQTDVARKLGVTQSTISQQLHNGMSLERFEEICKILGCEVILKKGDMEYGTTDFCNIG